ncbi:MAG: hypothetical protein FWB80_13165 [Defluviitaleaceae bacterium]|nr:hypothetical protein [Defluviitaleaceae bacterium]
MLQKVSDRKIMSMYEITLKYPEHFILAEVTETIDTQMSDLGYVMYIADDKDELYSVPKEEKQGKSWRKMTGYNAEKPFSLGLMIYE